MSTDKITSKTRRAYKFIDAHRDEFSIQMMCRRLGVARADYYAWREHPVEHPHQGRQGKVEVPQRASFTGESEAVIDSCGQESRVHHRRALRRGGGESVGTKRGSSAQRASRSIVTLRALGILGSVAGECHSGWRPRFALARNRPTS